MYPGQLRLSYFAAIQFYRFTNAKLTSNLRLGFPMHYRLGYKIFRQGVKMLPIGEINVFDYFLLY